MVDDERWSAVMPVGSYITVEMIGGEAQRKSTRNGRRATLSEEGRRQRCFSQDLVRAAVP
jgi:hypothetical protein